MKSGNFGSLFKGGHIFRVEQSSAVTRLRKVDKTRDQQGITSVILSKPQ